MTTRTTTIYARRTILRRRKRMTLRWPVGVRYTGTGGTQIIPGDMSAGGFIRPAYGARITSP